ncbi:MAG: EamA family transporter [Bacteroidales bacterium]|nr:EamA family transporter [Bacteroidales bacterium]
MLKLLALSLFQCALSALGQVFLKIAMSKAVKFEFTWTVIKSYLTNWNLLYSGLCMLGAMFTWFYILRHFEFSAAYPLTSFSYVLGVLAAMWFFGETVSPSRWLGLVLIVSGTFLLLK